MTHCASLWHCALSMTIVCHCATIMLAVLYIKDACSQLISLTVKWDSSSPFRNSFYDNDSVILVVKAGLVGLMHLMMVWLKAKSQKGQKTTRRAFSNFIKWKMLFLACHIKTFWPGPGVDYFNWPGPKIGYIHSEIGLKVTFGAALQNRSPHTPSSEPVSNDKRTHLGDKVHNELLIEEVRVSVLLSPLPAVVEQPVCLPVKLCQDFLGPSFLTSVQGGQLLKMLRWLFFDIKMLFC